MNYWFYSDSIFEFKFRIWCVDDGSDSKQNIWNEDRLPQRNGKPVRQHGKEHIQFDSQGLILFFEFYISHYSMSFIFLRSIIYRNFKRDIWQWSLWSPVRPRLKTYPWHWLVRPPRGHLVVCDLRTCPNNFPSIISEENKVIFSCNFPSWKNITTFFEHRSSYSVRNTLDSRLINQQITRSWFKFRSDNLKTVFRMIPFQNPRIDVMFLKAVAPAENRRRAVIWQG